MTTVLACAVISLLGSSGQTGVTLHLVHKNVFMLGAPMEFRCVLTNTTKRPVNVMSSGIWPNYRFTVKSAKGIEPALTAFGAKARARYRSKSRDKYFTVTIA